MLQPWGLLPELSWVLQWSVVIPVYHKKMQKRISAHFPQASIDSNTYLTQYISAIVHAYMTISTNKMTNTLATILGLAH